MFQLHYILNKCLRYHKIINRQHTISLHWNLKCSSSIAIHNGIMHFAIQVVGIPRVEGYFRGTYLALHASLGPKGPRPPFGRSVECRVNPHESMIWIWFSMVTSSTPYIISFAWCLERKYHGGPIDSQMSHDQSVVSPNTWRTRSQRIFKVFFAWFATWRIIFFAQVGLYWCGCILCWDFPVQFGKWSTLSQLPTLSTILSRLWRKPCRKPLKLPDIGTGGFICSVWLAGAFGQWWSYVAFCSTP